MRITPIVQQAYTAPGRGPAATRSAEGAADQVALSKTAPNQAAAGALTRLIASSNTQSANVEGFKVLDSIVKSSSQPVEQAFARAAHSAVGKRAWPETINKVEQFALGKLADGIAGAPGQALADLGKAVADSAKEPVEVRRMGRAVMEEIAKSSQSPTEKAYASAVLNAVCEQGYIEDSSAANVLKEAFSVLSAGTPADSDKAIAELGQKLPQLAADEGNACKMGAKLFDSMKESGSNINAERGSEISSKYAQTSPKLLKDQQDLFGHVVAGTESSLARPAFKFEASPNMNAAATFVAAAGLQAALAAAPIPGGFAGWIASAVVGGIAFAGIKGIYNGVLAHSKQINGEPSQGFGHGFKLGFKSNLWPSMIHGSIQTAAYSMMGPPWSFVAGPAVSAALNRFTPIG